MDRRIPLSVYLLFFSVKISSQQSSLWIHYDWREHLWLAICEIDHNAPVKIHTFHCQRRFKRTSITITDIILYSESCIINTKSLIQLWGWITVISTLKSCYSDCRGCCLAQCSVEIHNISTITVNSQYLHFSYLSVSVDIEYLIANANFL